MVDVSRRMTAKRFAHQDMPAWERSVPIFLDVSAVDTFRRHIVYRVE